MKILAFRGVTPCRLVKLSTFRRHYVVKTSVPIYHSTRCIMPEGLSHYTYRVLRTRRWTLSSRLPATPHYSCKVLFGGRVSVVRIATRYGLDVSGFEPRWARDFPYLSKPPWGPPILLYSGFSGSFSQVKRPGRGVNRSPLWVCMASCMMNITLYLRSCLKLSSMPGHYLPNSLFS